MRLRMPTPFSLYVFTTVATMVFAATAFAAPATYKIDPAHTYPSFEAAWASRCGAATQ